MSEVYTVPFVATTNAIISSSDANAGYAGNHRYVRQFITNPAGANLVLLSNGANGAAFNTVPDVALTNQKVNQVNPTFSTFGSATSSGSGFFDVAATGDAPNASGDSWGLVQYRHWNWAADYRWQLAVQFTNADQMWARSVIAGAGSTWRRLFHTGFMGSGSGLDADTLDTHDTSFFATATALAAAAVVPSGAIVGFRNAADLTAAGAGWVAETNLDGRIMVGSGTAGGQTFVPANSYGTSWTATTSGTAAATTGGGAVQGGGSSSADPQGHTHVTSGTVSLIPVLRAVAYGRKT
jgi:hypothetical protein